MIGEIENFYSKHRKYSRHIEIVTVKHTLSVAKTLYRQLTDLDYSCVIHEKMPLITNPNILYIVFAPQMWRVMPRNYIVYQVEQMTYDYCNYDKYFKLLEKASAIFDYSMVNIKMLKKRKELADKLYFLPFVVDTEILKENKEIVQKEYDAVFYGDSSSKRRREYLSEISKICNLKVISNKFGNDLIDEIKKAYIVLNIHYKDNAILETCRLSEVLSYGNNRIISENSIDSRLDAMYKDYIDFVDCGNIDAMKNKISKILHESGSFSDSLMNINKSLLDKEERYKSYFKEIFE